MPETITIYQDSGGDQDVVVNYDSAPSDFFAKQGFQIGTGFRSGVPVRKFTVLRFKIPFGLDKTLLSCKFIGIGFRQPGIVVSQGNYDAIRVTIALHDTDDATIPANRTAVLSVISGALTSAQIAWDPSSQLPVGAQGILISEDFKTALSEVLNRGGWAANQYICIYFITTLPTPVASDLFWGESQYSVDNNFNTPETHPQYWPRLEITYETPIGPGTEDRSYEDTLVVDQFIYIASNNLHLVDELTVEQDIDFDSVSNREVIDDLTIVETIHIPFSLTFDFGVDDIFITEDIFVSIVRTQVVEDELTIDEDIIRNGAKNKQILQLIDVDQDIDFTFAINRDVFDDLTVDQDIHSGTIQIDLFDTLTIGQIISIESILQVYSFVIDDLTIGEDIDYSLILTDRPIEDVLSVDQIIIGYIQGQGCSRAEHNYQPTVDSSLNFPVEPVLVFTHQLKLEYPVTVPLNRVILPAPLFGNREEMQVTRVQRRTVDDDLKTFVDEDWPRVRTFRYQFEGITDDLLLSYNNFILLSLGLEIKLTDYENRVWKGFIVTPNLEQADLSNDECQNTLGFEFMGVELDPDDKTGHIGKVKSGNTFTATVT